MSPPLSNVNPVPPVLPASAPVNATVGEVYPLPALVIVIALTVPLPSIVQVAVAPTPELSEIFITGGDE